MTLRLITAPTVEPVSLDEARLDLRREAGDTSLDADLANAIAACREQAEHELGRALVSQVWERVLDAFPICEIELGRPPVIEIISVVYIDADGAQQTVPASNYTLDATTSPGWVLPAAGYSWPATADVANAVRVRFRAGFGDAADAVPASIRRWIRANVRAWATCGSALSDKPLTPNPHLSSLLDQWRTYS